MAARDTVTIFSYVPSMRWLARWLAVTLMLSACATRNDRVFRNPEVSCAGAGRVEVGLCGGTCFIAVQGLESGSVQYYDREGSPLAEASDYAYDAKCPGRSAGTAPRCARRVLATLTPPRQRE